MSRGDMMRPEDKSPDLPQSYDELRLLYLEVYYRYYPRTRISFHIFANRKAEMVSTSDRYASQQWKISRWFDCNHSSHERRASKQAESKVFVFRSFMKQLSTKRPLLLSRKKNNAAVTLKWMKMEFIARKPDTQQKSEFLDLSKKNRLLDRPD